MSRNLDLICILYITGKINSLDALNELAGENDFLQFFVNHEEFDYSKVDFSKYMWENIARQPEFMIKLIDKANEVQRDFEKLSPENQARVMQDARCLALIKLGEAIK